jgi:hypothetical protein
MKKVIFLIFITSWINNVPSQTIYNKTSTSYSKFNIHCGLGAYCGIPLFYAGFNYRFNKSFSTDIELIENANFLIKDHILGINYHFKPNSGFIAGLNYSNLNAGSEHLYSISPNFGYILFDPEYLPSLKFAIGYGPAYFKVDGGRKNVYGVLNIQLVIGFQFFNKSL